MSCESPTPASYARGGDGHFHPINTHFNDPFSLTPSRSYATWVDRIGWDFDFDLFLDPQLPGDTAADGGKPIQQLSPSETELSSRTEDEGKYHPEQMSNNFVPYMIPSQDHRHDSHLYPSQCLGCASCQEMGVIPLPTPSATPFAGISPLSYSDATAYRESPSPSKKRKASTATTATHASSLPHPNKVRKLSVAAGTRPAASRPSKRPRSVSNPTKPISLVPMVSKPSQHSPPPAPAPVPLPERAHSAIEKRYRASLNDKFEALRSCLIRAKPWLAEQNGDGESSEKGVGGSGGGDEKGVPKMNKTRVLSEAVVYIKHLEEQAWSWQEQAEALQQRILSSKMALEGEQNGGVLDMHRQG